MRRSVYPRLSPNELARMADRLRHDGYYAYLDGRVAYARKLYRKLV